MAELKDSGNRREFESGAVRDMQEGKGRMDLVPWGVCNDLYTVMHQLFRNNGTGFTPDLEHEKHWLKEPLSNAYPKILVEMDAMDSLLNLSYPSSALTPTHHLELIKSHFLHMAAVFCLYHWYITKLPESIGDNLLAEAENDIINGSFGCAMLEVAKHYEDGARKYEENNWRKGMDPKIYFDSASRHLIKCMLGWTDEPHDRAFLWNCLCGAWECDVEIYKIENCCNTSYAVSGIDELKKAYNDLSNSILPNR